MSSYKQSFTSFQTYYTTPRYTSQHPTTQYHTTDYRAILGEYTSALMTLPPFAPAARKYISHLDDAQRKVFTSLVPLAAAMRKGGALTNLEAFDAAKNYALEKIEAALGGTQQAHAHH